MRGKLSGQGGAKSAITMIAAIAVVLVSAVPASAGQLTLMINAGGSGCNLLTPYGVSSPLYATPCGAGPLSVGFHAASATLVGSTIGGPDMRRMPWSVPAGTRVGYQITAPPGVTINDATISSGSTSNINTGTGWGGASYWAGGDNQLSSNSRQRFHSNAINQDGPFDSSYWGVAMVCGWARCTGSAQLSVNSVILTATENQLPSLTAVGSNNLWYQTNHWIWNAPGDPWPLTLAASDISGICILEANVGNHYLSDPLPAANTSQWQQCPDPTWTPGQGAAVDTRDYVIGAGQLPLTLDAANAAQVKREVSETLNVDNDPVSVSLSTPDDPNSSVWVNHRVTIDANATAGPSGVAGTSCSTAAAAAQAYPAGGVTVNGDGVHTVTCSSWNNAVNPEGSPASGTSSITVHIDEAAPTLSLEPENPNDPTAW
jgi:hypothetical protein